MRAWLLATLCAATIAACGPPATRTTFPPLGSTPGPAGDATAATRQAIVGALSAAGLQAVDAPRAFRPPEGPLLSAAPRTVLQVPLPDDPAGAWIVIYALASPADATAAANDHAAYVASNIGRINFPTGTQFVVRVAGSTVVFFTWNSASPDRRSATIAQVLQTIGTGVTVPS